MILIVEYGMIRSGIGIDMCPFSTDGKLILGGLEIEHPQGLKGCFDADVLSHSIGDSLLGAANFGTQQDLFPSDDPKYKDISGIKLLELIKIKLVQARLYIENVDATILCHGLDLREHKTYITINLAHALNMEINRISIKVSSAQFGLVTDLKKTLGVLSISTLLELDDLESDDIEEFPEEEFYE
jgi:2-C-methyl-D-erythritol 2,4-cyclodiphosphate synthase